MSLVAAAALGAAATYAAQFDCSTKSTLDNAPYAEFKEETFTFDGLQQGDVILMDGTLQDGRHVLHRGQVLFVRQIGGLMEVGFQGHGLLDTLRLNDWQDGRATYDGYTLLTDGAGSVHTVGTCRSKIPHPPSPDNGSVK